MSSPKYLVIFDWDDTVFPTTALFKNRDKVNIRQLTEFGKSAHDLICRYIDTFSAENVYIVTNGSSKWLKQSLGIIIERERASSKTDLYWSRIKEILSTTLRGQVISTSLYGETYPNQPVLWKTLVFNQIAVKHFDGSVQRECTIISIGDSSVEFKASLETKEYLQSDCEHQMVNLIRVSLAKKPSRALMMNQFDALCRISNGIVNDKEGSSYDIDIAKYLGSDQAGDLNHALIPTKTSNNVR